MSTVALTKLIDKMKLTNLTPDIDISEIKISQPDINRPALQLTGFFEHFERSRVQIIGFVEYTYMQNMDDSRKREIYTKMLEDDVAVPCFVFCRGVVTGINIVPLMFNSLQAYATPCA